MGNTTRSSTNRFLALVAGLTALYLAYGYASGYVFQHSIFELDLFFLISTFFTIIVSLTGRRWSATVLGTICALLLFGDPNAPVGIGLSLIPNGLVFDLALRRRNGFPDELSKNQFVVAGALGNLAMAITGLLIAAGTGLLPTNGVPLVINIVVGLVGNPIVGAMGALFGIVVVERVRGQVRPRLIC